jgi:pimeloyl-ACP methyl ester carboxylesterase
LELKLHPKRYTARRAAHEHPAAIVLIHGFWVTPRSWEEWIAHYEAKGHRVIAPAYPASRSKWKR